MKKLNVVMWIFVSMFVVLSLGIVQADTLTTSLTDLTFEKGVEKEIRFAMPANCSAMNGTISLINATLVSISEDYATKDFDINNDKFILYGINQDVMDGYNLVIKIIVNNNSPVSIFINDCAGATPDAQAIIIDNFILTIGSSFDLNDDGVLDGLDVAIMITNIFCDNATIVDLQTIINAIIDEMG